MSGSKVGGLIYEATPLRYAICVEVGAGVWEQRASESTEFAARAVADNLCKKRDVRVRVFDREASDFNGW